MVGHDGMKNADNGDGEDEQEARSVIHAIQSGAQEEQAHVKKLYAAQSARRCASSGGRTLRKRSKSNTS